MHLLSTLALAFALGCAAQQPPVSSPAATKPADPTATAPPVAPAEPTTQPAAAPPSTGPVKKPAAEPKPTVAKPQTGGRPLAQPFADKDKKSRFRVQFPLDHVRRLEGRWATKAQGETPSFQMQARSVAGGSTILEIMFPDKDFDNVSCYTAIDDDLILTYFSCLNNVPRLRAKTTGDGWKPGELTFVLEGGLRIPESGRYLKSLKIEFVDDETVRYVVQFVSDGKDMEPGTLEFHRTDTKPPPAPPAPPAPAAVPTPSTAPVLPAPSPVPPAPSSPGTGDPKGG